MAACIAAAETGASVLLLERMPQLGRKIPATGNGRCNLTNLRVRRGKDMTPFYRGQETSFAGRVLSQFDSTDTIRFFQSIGVYTHDRDGYVYPLSDQASTVRDALERAVRSFRSVTVREGVQVTKARFVKDGRYFQITAGQETFRAAKLIIASGGQSQSRLGSDGSGYALCRSFGHKVIPAVPALCALHAADQAQFFKTCAGVRCRAAVSVFENGSFMESSSGELQLTAYGLSGIPVFQISRFAAYALRQRSRVSAQVDFVPEMREGKLRTFLQEEGRRHPDYTAEQVLCGIVNSRLAQALCRIAGIRPQQRMKDSDRQLAALVRSLKKLRFEIKGTNDFDQSQVTAGGISTREIDSNTMMSRLVPGLYITGELLDIEGICGGFNLQWAWATGVLAGRHAAGGRHA